MRTSGEGRKHAYRRTLIRQQAHEIDDLWDRLSRAYALVRNESSAEMIQQEMREIHAMLEGRRISQLGMKPHLSKTRARTHKTGLVSAAR